MLISYVRPISPPLDHITNRSLYLLAGFGVGISLMFLQTFVHEEERYNF